LTVVLQIEVRSAQRRNERLGARGHGRQHVQRRSQGLLSNGLLAPGAAAKAENGQRMINANTATFSPEDVNNRGYVTCRLRTRHK
jgi:hypothetical protein